MTFATDKETHGYLPDYLVLIAELGPAAVICEVGIESGGSLSMWQALCPDGTIIGVDHNPECHWPEDACRVLASQDDPKLPEMVRKVAPDGCNLVVDDASHIGHLSKATFDLLWPLVRPGGYYVVEDWADPWISPELPRWPDVDPSLAGDELLDFVPSLITALQEGASRVTYTYEGLVIIKRQP